MRQIPAAAVSRQTPAMQQRTDPSNRSNRCKIFQPYPTEHRSLSQQTEPLQATNCNNAYGGLQQQSRELQSRQQQSWELQTRQQQGRELKARQQQGREQQACQQQEQQQNNALQARQQHVAMDNESHDIPPVHHPLTAIVNGARVPLTESTLVSMKVPTLKTLAQQFCLKSGGKKMHLIERILEYATKQQQPALPIPMAPPAPPQPSLQQPIPSPDVNQQSPAPQTTQPSASLTTQPSAFFPFQPNSCTTSIALRNCICGGASATWPGPAISCTSCGVRLHAVCMKWDVSRANGASFLCPLCRMKGMDPFYPAISLLWMHYFHVGQVGVTVLENADGDTTCILPSAVWLEVPQLHAWRRARQEVVVRCVKLETPTGINHEWPRTLDLKVLDSVECVFAPRADHKRRDVPFIITQFLKSATNYVEIIASELLDAAETTAYALGIFLCATVDIPMMVEQVKSNTKESYEEHFSRGKKLDGVVDSQQHYTPAVFSCYSSTRLTRDDNDNNDDDDDDCSSVLKIVADDGEEDEDVACVERSRKIKLSCPITLTRMSIAARGRSCRHLQCFDLESFIAVTRQSKAFNNRWKCPECSLILRDIVVDHYNSEAADIVEIGKQGSWNVLQPIEINNRSMDEEDSNNEDDVMRRDHNNRPIWEEPITIEDIDDSDSEGNTSPSVPVVAPVVPVAPSVVPPRVCNVDVIDLSPATSTCSTIELTEADDENAHPLPRAALDVRETAPDPTCWAAAHLFELCSDGQLRRKRPRSDEEDDDDTTGGIDGGHRSNDPFLSRTSTRAKRPHTTDGSSDRYYPSTSNNQCRSITTPPSLTPAQHDSVSPELIARLLADETELLDSNSISTDNEPQHVDYPQSVDQSSDWMLGDLLDIVLRSFQSVTESSLPSQPEQSSDSAAEVLPTQSFIAPVSTTTRTVVKPKSDRMAFTPLDLPPPSINESTIALLLESGSACLSQQSQKMAVSSPGTTSPVIPIAMRGCTREQPRVPVVIPKQFVPIPGPVSIQNSHRTDLLGEDTRSVLAAAALVIEQSRLDSFQDDELPTPSSPARLQQKPLPSVLSFSPSKLDSRWLPIGLPPKQAQEDEHNSARSSSMISSWMAMAAE